MYDDELSPIVIDNGSDMCKAGFAGNDVPAAVSPNIVGQERPQPGQYHERQKFVGNRIKLMKDIYSLRHPIEQGTITRWDDMEHVWHELFYGELRVAPEEHHVLLTEAAITHQADREKLTQIMFETFWVQGMYAANPAALSLYASGRTTGLVLDSGQDISRAVAIADGCIVPDSTVRLRIAGQDMTEHLIELLVKRERDFRTISRKVLKDALCDIKENLCYVALDYEKEMQNTEADLEKTYQLPDGQILTIGNERFRCPEALFKPSLLKSEYFGVQELPHRSISYCIPDVRKDLFANIVLAGGSTLFEGFVDRMQKEITALAPSDVKVNIIASPERKYTAWLGGSMLATLSTFQQMWITRKDYEEYGRSIIHRKCDPNSFRVPTSDQK